MTKPLLLTALLWAAAGLPAVASNLPPIDLEPWHGQLTGGLGAVAADVSLLPGWSLGATLGVSSFNMGNGSNASYWAGRVTGALWRLGDLRVGLTLSGGQASETVVDAYIPGRGLGSVDRQAWWVQPALNVGMAWALPWEGVRLHLRGTLGPSWRFDATNGTTMTLMPNAEVAIAFPGSPHRDAYGVVTPGIPTPAHEIVLGGGSIVAYRFRL